MPPARACTALTAFLLLAGAAAAREPWEGHWIEVRTPHFAVASALDAQRTVELARDLEDFRQLVEMLTTVGRFEERVPTWIYVFRGHTSEVGLVGDRWGYLLPGMRANYAVLRAGTALELEQVLFHEYVHFLVRNRDQLDYPAWFDEGFAELLATLSLEDRTFELGRAPKPRNQWLARGKWMDFQQLLAERDARALTSPLNHMFYAQSWALVHYLVLGRGADFGPPMTRYLEAVERGTGPDAAFEQSFGIEIASLERTLRQYLSREIQFKRGTLTEPFSTSATRVREIPVDEVAARIGRLALLLGQREDARKCFEAALASNADNATAKVGLAALHQHEGRFTEAEPLYLEAIALEPADPLHELDYGEYLLDRARAPRGMREIGREWLREARRHFVRSHELDAANPETLAMYGSTFFFTGEPTEKGLEALERANDLLPSSPQIKFMLAVAYVTLQRPDAARPLLRRILAWSHAENAEAARKLLGQIEGAGAGDAAPVLPGGAALP